uniref:Uncharacterized protein n=1 Tax=Acrobeloides nanus TaxID=290746 RepID=A0A914ELX3_9BILA
MKKHQKILNWVIRFIIFGSYVVLTSCRHHHKKNEIQPRDECFYQFPNNDHHQRLAEWIHAKNSSNYSPFLPYEQELFELEAEDFRDGIALTSGISCHSKKHKIISENMPLNEKALCPFDYVLNYNPKRIPAALTEVKCSCQKPSSRYIRSHVADCQPLFYNIRVLMFDDKCNSYKEKTEAVSMACIPVLRALRDAENDREFLTVIKAEIP